MGTMHLNGPDVRLESRVTDSSSAVAHVDDTVNALSTSGAKLRSVRNNGTEKFSIDKDGNPAFGGAKIIAGTGDPESAVTAAVGSLFLRTDGGANTTLYVKQTGAGNTGWAAVTP